VKYMANNISGQRALSTLELRLRCAACCTCMIVHQVCEIISASHTPATTKMLVKAKATAFTIIRCRYSSLLSLPWYLLKSGTGERSGSALPIKLLPPRLMREPPLRGLKRIT
jgi:hypothetical protein